MTINDFAVFGAFGNIRVNASSNIKKFKYQKVNTKNTNPYDCNANINLLWMVRIQLFHYKMIHGPTDILVSAIILLFLSKSWHQNLKYPSN